MLSEKDTRRIQAVLNGSCLETMGPGSKNPKICKLNINFDNLKGFNGMPKAIADTLLLSGQTHVEKNLFRMIDPLGVENILQYTSEKNWKENSSLGDMTIQTVLGGSEQMSMRVLAYFLPALQMGEQLLETVGPENMTNIVFTVANGSAIALNGFDESKVKHQTSQVLNLVYEYIKEYKPHMIDHVSFFVDENFTENILQDSDWNKIVVSMEQIAKENPELFLPTEQHAKNKGLEKTDYCYEFLHPFEHDVQVLGSSPGAHTNFFTGEQGLPQSEIILSTGCVKEIDFYRIRKAILRVFEFLPYVRSVKTAQYVTNFTTAPYYMLPKGKGDLSLDEIIANPNMTFNCIKGHNGNITFNHAVQGAYSTILRDTKDLSGESFASFLGNFNPSEMQERIKEGEM